MSALPDPLVHDQQNQRNFEHLSRRFPLTAGGQNFSQMPFARAIRATNLAIPGTGVDTVVAWDGEDFDQGAEHHSTTANTSRLTCVVPGTYLIVGSLAYAANAVGQRSARIILNGATILVAEERNTAAAGYQTQFSLSTLYPLAVGDYVQMIANQNSGGNLNITAPDAFSNSHLAFIWSSP